MMIKNCLLILLTTMLCFATAFADEMPEFHNIGIRDGLSNGFVIDMAKDNQGFIWVGTESGLNRIAGQNVSVFNKSNSGLLDNIVTALYFDKEDNKLWVASQKKGISIYDCSTGKFDYLTIKDGLSSNTVTDISEASDGGIWLLHYDKGVQHYSKKGEFTKLDFSSKVSRFCLDDGNHHLYIGHTMDGLSLFDLSSGSIKHYRHDPDNPKSLPSNNVRCIFIDHKGNIWIGTNYGLALFDPANDEFNNFNEGLAGNNIMSITETGDGTLLISSDLGGISAIDIESGSFDAGNKLDFHNFTTNNSGLSSPNSRRVIVDEYDNIWIGNYSAGVDIIYGRSPDFSVIPLVSESNGKKKRKPIYGIAGDRSGNLWLGGENELTLFSKGKFIKSYKVIPNDTRTESLIYSIHIARNGLIWLGINDAGVQIFNPEKGVFKELDLGEPFLDIHAFWEDSDGTIWIGSENGLFSYKDGNVTKEDKYNKQLAGQVIYSILRDSKGFLWVGTLGYGLDIFDTKGKLSKHLGNLPSDNINHIFSDSNDNIWIATSDGLVRINNNKAKVYGSPDGLADSHVRAVTEDRFGNIWLSTYSGISCLRKNNENFWNFNFNDGTPIGGFAESSVANLPDGTVYFGSPDGVCVFNPYSFNEHSELSPLEIIETTRLDDNSFKISFTVRNYAETGSACYAYKLEGLDKEWHPVEGEGQVVIRNIPPGNYTFMLKARNKNGKWENADIASVPLEVEPPLWATWWAKTIYVLFAIGIISLIVWIYNRHIFLKKSLDLRRSSLEMEQKMRQEEQNLNDERLRFYTNITHELRTPLTLILGPLEDLNKDNGVPSKYRHKIQTIHTSALRLLNLINQILEFRKTETQNRHLTVERNDLSALVKEIGLRYKELNRNEKITFSIDVKPLGRDIFFDRDIITTILNNLLSNAMKYTPEGEIVLGLTSVNDGGSDYAEISVKDTGYGIDKEALPHIFERYYQAEGKHQASGTGIGLALVKSLADLHEGILDVKSKTGVGTVFSFRMLIDNSYPNALHKEANIDVKANAEVVSDDLENNSSNDSPILLVVEDDAGIRDYICDSLGDTYKIVIGVNGKEGLERAKEYTPDIIVSDIMMPEMNGIELCRTLKDDILTSHIPVILLTAKDSLSDKEEGYDSGADSYLTKPFSANLLRSRIHNLLEARRKLAKRFSEKPADVSASEPNQSQSIILNPLDKEFLEKLTSLIETHLDAEKLDMDFITDKMNMSYSTLYRKVKALTDLTVSEFTLKIKLKSSVELLKTGRYNITEVASMTGFNAISYFRKCFKEEYNVSPSEFLKNLRT